MSEPIPAEAPEVAALTAELREVLAPGLTLLRALGQGWMGTVFLARDPALKRNVVVKVLSPALAADEGARRRFAREAEAAAAVAHPNVVSVFQVGELPRSRTTYFVMQYIEGQTLEAACPAGTQVPVARVKRIVGEIASALAAAHARGLVHRDIKPANVMLEAESDRVIVLDFGISAAVSPERQAQSGTKLTQQGTSLGTPEYMSPEQAAGESVTDRSDVYSLGLIAFELLTGRAVFEERTPMALLAAHINREPPKVATLRADLEPAFADLIDRCLLKDPEKRPAAADISRMLVPPAQPRIEWPPPGLERVHGRGWDLAKVATWTAAAVTAVFLLLYLQPVVSTGAWTREETSWLWRALWAPQLSLDAFMVRPVECSMWRDLAIPCPPSVVEASPVWLFALAALAVFAAVGFVFVASNTLWLVRVLRSGRKAGYPWSALMAVAWDAGPDTASLLNGQGAFVLLTAAERDDLMRRRRAAQRWLLGGAAVTAAMPILWYLGVIVLGDARERTVTTVELPLFTGPLLAGIAGWIATLMPERRLRSRGRRAARRGMNAVSVAPALVDGWLAAAGRPEPQPASRVRTAGAFGVPVAVTAAVILGMLPIVLYAFFESFIFGPTMRSEAQAWLAFAQLPRGDSWKGIDQRLQLEIARIPQTRRELGRVVRQGAVPDSNWLPPWRQTTAALIREPVWTWLPGWRRAITEIGRLDESRADTLPRAVLNEYDGAVRAVAAAGLAFDAGDSAAGWQWLREALLVGRYQLRQRGDVYPLHAALMARGRLADRLGDTATVAAMRDLINRIQRNGWAHIAFYVFTPYTLMADPDSPPGERFIQDTTLAPWVRRRLALGTVAGMCLNPRELLFGMSARRRVLVQRVSAGSLDLPSVGQGVRAVAASYDAKAGTRRGLLGLPARFTWCVGRPAHVFRQ
jgi:hypothetical protein